MAHLGEHHLGGGADVDLLEGDTERRAQAGRVASGVLTGGESGQAEGQDVATRTPLPVHRPRRDDQGVGGVQTAGDPDDDLGVVQRAQPLLEAGDLDVVALVAVLLEPCGVVGHERESLDLTAQPDVPARRVEPETDAAKRVQSRPVVAAVVVEGAHPQPLGAQQVQIDVGHRVPLPFREPLRGGQQPAVLVDHGLAVPGQIGAGLALPGRGVDVGRQAARRGRSGQQAAVLGAPDGDGAAGEVGQHGGAGQCGLRTGRHRDEHVLADLHVQHQTGDVLGGEEQVRAERDVSPQQPDGPGHIVPRRELAPLIELPVRGQIGLDRHAEHRAAVDHHRGVVDPVQMAQRGAHDEHRQQIGRGVDHVGKRRFDGVEQGVLQQDVLDRVARQRQLRKDRHRHAVLVAVPGDSEHRLGVGGRVGQHRVVGAGGHPGESAGIGGEKVHAPLSQPLCGG